jgi:ABC-type ATPase with predicted acetyltransferase domain
MDNTNVTDTEQEQRYRASQKMRSHKVELGRCPTCGATIPANLIGHGRCVARTAKNRSES